MRWRGALAAGLTLGLALGACAKQQDDAPAPAPPPAIPAAELARGQQACQAYVTAVCACAETVPAATAPCALARSLPEAIDVATQVTMTADAKREDVLQAADSVRKTIARCIEQTAQLPALGCPVR